MTFSIVGFDPQTGDLGIAVASKFLAVGAVVPWAVAGVGAVATQSYANTAYGPRGLELLRGGLDPREVIERLTAPDPDANVRQVGVVDASGRSATFSGPKCHAWAGGREGQAYACQGNILSGPEVVDALAGGFATTASADLAERLLTALAAGQAAGGDRRGQQSAALLVVRGGAGYGGGNDRYVDLRVDDHRQPIDELRRVLQLWRLYFQTPDVSTALDLSPAPALTAEIQTLLTRAGTYAGPINGQWNPDSQAALRAWAGVENLEERVLEHGIDPIVLRHLREQHAE